MKRPPFLAATVSLLCLASGIFAPGVADAATETGKGAVAVTFKTPDGVPGSVTLAAAQSYVASKAPAGTGSTVTVPVAPGSYHVDAAPLTYDGRFYSPSASRPEVPVAAGATEPLTVTYVRQDAARDFRVADITKSAISLTWTAGSQYQITVRRTASLTPAKAPDQGVAVPVSGNVATDSGLQAGTQYTYALFAQANGKWIGPMTVRAGTASTTADRASYVAGPLTLIAGPGDVVNATTTGSGVVVTLAAGLGTPVVGGAVVLPVSEALPGGYLGIVTAVSLDGHTATLVAGGISDAFDYYNVSVENFSASQQLFDPEEGEGDAEPSSFQSGPSDTSSLSAEPASYVAKAASAAPASAAMAAPAASGLGPALWKCLGGSFSKQFSFQPSITTSGHFNATISKFSIFGKEIPKGASLDMSVATTVAGAASVTTSGSLSCNATPKVALVPIVQTPVPISLYFAPTVGVSIGGTMQASNIGAAVTAGFEFAGNISPTDASLSGSPILTAKPLTPKVVKSGSFSVKLGGQLIVGPGAGTPAAGVIAGVSGYYNPLDATFNAVFPQDDPNYNACLSAKIGYSLGLGVTAKAWVGNWEISKTFTLDALNKTGSYGGSPWYLPEGCENVIETPSDTVLGDGVTKVDDGLTGDGGQWDYVPGFVPGKKTWVLSTGKVDDAVGEPSTFASSSLNGAGDADLTALSGHPTYDAVAYSATVIPTGSTLHVRYAFASEEYPEYVGSSFNDVMAIFVNGENCATVPGTVTPVSINTINDHTNAGYYVDNSQGASGYGTTMDGLTTPLECKASVTIGQPVTVKIAVADATDSAYDSAVALLDKGIWSD
jgi:hypothetical protein